MPEIFQGNKLCTGKYPALFLIILVLIFILLSYGLVNEKFVYNHNLTPTRLLMQIRRVIGIEEEPKSRSCYISPEFYYDRLFKATWIKKDVLLLLCSGYDDRQKLITWSIPQNEYSHYTWELYNDTAPEGISSDGRNILLYEAGRRTAYIQRDGEIIETIDLGRIVDEKKLASPLVKVRVDNSLILGDISVFGYLFFSGGDLIYCFSHYQNLPNNRTFPDSFSPFLKKVQVSSHAYLYLQKDKELYEYSIKDDKLSKLFSSPSELVLWSIKREGGDIYFSGYFEDDLEKKLKEEKSNPSISYCNLYKYNNDTGKPEIYMNGAEIFDKSENYLVTVRMTYLESKNRRKSVSILSIFDKQEKCIYRKEFSRRMRMAPLRADIYPMISEDEKYVVFLHEEVMEDHSPLVVKLEELTGP